MTMQTAKSTGVTSSDRGSTGPAEPVRKDILDLDMSNPLERREFFARTIGKPYDVMTVPHQLKAILSATNLERSDFKSFCNLDFSACRSQDLQERTLLGLKMTVMKRSSIFDFACNELAGLIKQIQQETRKKGVAEASAGSVESNLDLRLGAFVSILTHLQELPGQRFGFKERNLNKSFEDLLEIVEARKGSEKYCAMLLPLKDKASSEIAERITSVKPTTGLHL